MYQPDDDIALGPKFKVKTGCGWKPLIRKKSQGGGNKVTEEAIERKCILA